MVTTGAGAFVGELVMFKSKSNAAVVDETDATIVEEVASPADTLVASVEVVVVVFPADTLVASVEVVVVVFAAAIAAASVEVDVVMTAGQQISSDCLIISQRASPFSCPAASGNKSAQVLPATVAKVKGAVIPPGQTTQEDPEPVVVNIASVDAANTVLFATAAAVELTTTAAAELLVATAAAVVEPVSVVLIAATVVATSGQQVSSKDLIRPQILSSASNRAASACIVPQTLFPSVSVSASTVIPLGHAEQVVSDSGPSITGISVVVPMSPPQHSSSNPLMRSQMPSSASNLAASLWMFPHVFPFSVSVPGSTLIPPGHTEHSSAWMPVRMAAAVAMMGNFISSVGVLTYVELCIIFYVWGSGCCSAVFEV